MSLNSTRAPDAPKDFTLYLDWEGLTSLATVAGSKAVSLDVVTANDPILKSGYYDYEETSKEMMDGIFIRFPGLKLIKFSESSPGICGYMISSFLDIYQVQRVYATLQFSSVYALLL